MRVNSKAMSRKARSQTDRRLPDTVDRRLSLKSPGIRQAQPFAVHSVCANTHTDARQVSGFMLEDSRQSTNAGFRFGLSSKSRLSLDHGPLPQERTTAKEHNRRSSYREQGWVETSEGFACQHGFAENEHGIPAHNTGQRRPLVWLPEANAQVSRD